MSSFVKVVWRDIKGVSSKDNSVVWFTRDEALIRSKELYNQEYTTVGEIIADTNDFIVIAGTCDNDKEEPLYSDASMIMKSVIIRMEILK